jgi:CheY-like chemotaxis protein
MVYGMARQSGGRARIESTPGEGTAVKLCSAAEATRPPRSAGRGGDGRAGAAAGSILVIDDDPDVRDFIVDHAGGAGYRVRQAATATQASRKQPGQARPRHPRLHHARPVRRRGRRPLLAKRPTSRSCSCLATVKPKAVRRRRPDAPLLSKPFRADALTQSGAQRARPAGVNETGRSSVEPAMLRGFACLLLFGASSAIAQQQVATASAAVTPRPGRSSKRIGC